MEEWVVEWWRGGVMKLMLSRIHSVEILNAKARKSKDARELGNFEAKQTTG